MTQPRAMFIGIAAFAVGFMMVHSANAATPVNETRIVSKPDVVSVASKSLRLRQHGFNGLQYGRDGNGVKHHGYLTRNRGHGRRSRAGQGHHKLTDQGVKKGQGQHGPAFKKQ